MRWLSVLLLAGCGFVGEPPFAGQRVADVAPWEDLGPITVCDGTRRLGPALESALGTCGPALRSCTRDGDCGTREACLCGACQRLVCDTNDECGKGQARLCTFADRVCDRTCVADAECAPGEICVPGQHICRGTCTPDSAASDCQAGEKCNLATGRCDVVTCVDGSSCGGRACQLERLPAELRQPAPIVVNDQVVLYFERNGDIWRASSGDGRTFTLAERVVPGATAPAALADGALAWVSGGAIFVDGVQTIANADQPALSRQAAGPLVVYFQREGAIWRFPGDTRVLAPADVSTDLWRDVDALASPFIDEAGRLWFAAHGTETGPSMQFGNPVPTPPDWSIGLQGWPYNPVFERALDFTQHPSELDPAIVTFRGEQLLYYRRAAPDGGKSENLTVARNPPQPR